ncbi:MAG: sigma-54 dependent transcriptional regulator [Candidatus Hydrogenedentes bacterium]|nr:sigma-54 dependent transcriptional regulator [Candidatus Hydrogenedentota bacterium]
MPKEKILIIDDDQLMREFLEEALNRLGYKIVTTSNGKEAINLLKNQSFDLILTDLKMEPIDGIEVLKKSQQICPETPVIIMTAYATIETAISTLKSGAVDYLIKPFTPETLEIAIKRALEKTRIKAENKFLRAELRSYMGPSDMIGNSKAMKELKKNLLKIATSNSTVLIRGETGVGKELVARAIHYNSPRKDKPFIKVNCAALSSSILESELFGHEKGAFTGAHERKLGRFELANGGSLLLDEISEIHIDLQPKLLRALQEKEIERVGGTETIPINVRIIATTNRNLEEAIEKGTFREDLFFRLNVITMHVPPLRERKEDIPELTEYFVKKFSNENGKHIEGISQEAMEALLEYDWPGNVRELQNIIERAVVLAENKKILELNDLGFLKSMGIKPFHRSSFTRGITLHEAEKKLILQTLEYCNGNKTKTAEMLGISVRTLRNKLHEYGFAQPKKKK